MIPRPRRVSAAQRILMLTADFAPGNWSGIGVAVAAQARALVEVGNEVEVLWAKDEPYSRSSREPGGVVLHRQGVERCAVLPAEFDVLHVHSLALTELALEMSVRFDKPLVYTCHGLVEQELPRGPRRSFWGRAQRELVRRADWVLFLNASERDLACRENPGLAARSSTGINGLEFSSLERPSVTRRRDTLLFVGRFAQSKGIASLEASCHELLASDNLQLIIAGGHGDDEGEAAVARMQSRHGARCRVLPWQTREQLRELYLSAALTLLPSRYEPFGLVAVEAMAHGCPVLARSTGGLSEIVEPGFGNALLLGAEPAVWADAIRASLAASAPHAGLPEAVSRAVRERFSGARCAATLTEVYRRLIHDLPSSRPRSPAQTGRVHVHEGLAGELWPVSASR
jgi:glycosyltransferase involved in cell wall biosynthesis